MFGGPEKQQMAPPLGVGIIPPALILTDGCDHMSQRAVCDGCNQGKPLKMSKKVFLLLTLLLCFADSNATSRPIIGILAQETSRAINKHFPNATSYISAAYVKSVEASGARVAPIFINRTEDYYRSILSSINGLLLPGGFTWFDTETKGYAYAGKIIYDLIKKENGNGYFPVLGICLGLELLLYLDNNRQEFREKCQSNGALPLEFLPNFRNSHLFRNASEHVVRILSEEPVTYNHHMFCITHKNLLFSHLGKKWRPLSQNHDDNGVPFISALESTELPIAGIQFHPEKNAYEWREDLMIPHHRNALEASRYFFDWLVSMSLRNENKFQNSEEESSSLIYNYDASFTRGKLIYNELYLFTDR